LQQYVGKEDNSEVVSDDESTVESIEQTELENK
jgi:hypothetical protein